MIIQASSDENDVVWEPFGGLFSASLAAINIGRKAFSCEINPYYFKAGISRFSSTLQKEFDFTTDQHSEFSECHQEEDRLLF